MSADAAVQYQPYTIAKARVAIIRDLAMEFIIVVQALGGDFLRLYDRIFAICASLRTTGYGKRLLPEEVIILKIDSYSRLFVCHCADEKRELVIVVSSRVLQWSHDSCMSGLISPI